MLVIFFEFSFLANITNKKWGFRTLFSKLNFVSKCKIGHKHSHQKLPNFYENKKNITSLFRTEVDLFDQKLFQTWLILIRACARERSDDVSGGFPITASNVSIWPPRFTHLVPLITFNWITSVVPTEIKKKPNYLW